MVDSGQRLVDKAIYGEEPKPNIPIINPHQDYQAAVDEKVEHDKEVFYGNCSHQKSIVSLTLLA